MPDTPLPAFNFEALTAAWEAFAQAAGIPLNYCGDSTAAAHDGAEQAQAMLRAHIVATNDYRLFALLHLLGNASLRMEQVLDPVGYAEAEARAEAALAEAELTAERGPSDAEVAAHLETSLLLRHD